LTYITFSDILYITLNVIFLGVIYIRDNIKGGALTETTFLVLLAVYAPNHGYGIMQFIEKETCGRVILGAGTLYGAINSLVKKKWIVPFGSEIDSKKKEYVITDVGKQKAVEELKRMGDVLKLASTIIKGDRRK
jgi:DNA-binding PadR family transcriptional regulator